MKRWNDSSTAEQALLASILFAADPVLALREMVALGVAPDRFNGPREQACWESMVYAAKVSKALDPVTVHESAALMQRDAGPAGGRAWGELVSMDYLAKEIGGSKARASPLPFARLVMEHAGRRDLHALAGETRERLESGETKGASDERTRLSSGVAGLSASSDTGGVKAGPATQAAYRRYIDRSKRTRPPGTPLGVDYLDGVYGGGLQRKRVYVVGARPGVGKSAIGLQFLNHSCVGLGVPWQFHTLEMDIDESTGRLQSQRASVDASWWEQPRLASDDDNKRTLAAITEIHGAPLEWRESTSAAQILASIEAWGMDPATWRALEVANEARGESGLVPVAAIDHLHFVRSGVPRESLLDFLARFMAELKQVTKRTGIAAVVLAQLNRSSTIEHRAPTMADLRGGGGIEENSDGIMLIDRDPSGPEPAKAMAIIDKMRGGRTGRFPLRFVGKYVRFEATDLY